MRFYVGTSGYSYPKWKGSFYPAKLPQTEMLKFYAERFAAVEVNNSFYRMPSVAVLKSWAEQAPESFEFAFKAPQAISHFKRLKAAAVPTKRFLKTVGVLKSRCGPLLFGLGPNFKKDLRRLVNFLKLLRGERRVAFEFRHLSWFDDEVFDCLSKHGCALCTADEDKSPFTNLVSTANWGYVRLRRENYTGNELRAWIKRIRSQAWDETYVFFKHEDTGKGPKFATQLLELAGKTEL